VVDRQDSFVLFLSFPLSARLASDFASSPFSGLSVLSLDSSEALESERSTVLRGRSSLSKGSQTTRRRSRVQGSFIPSLRISIHLVLIQATKNIFYTCFSFRIAMETSKTFKPTSTSRSVRVFFPPPFRSLLAHRSDAFSSFSSLARSLAAVQHPSTIPRPPSRRARRKELASSHGTPRCESPPPSSHPSHN